MLDPSFALVSVLGLATLALKLWALIDAILRPGPAYAAAGKLSKGAWVAILAVAVVLGGSSVFGLFGLIGTVAAIVYLVDVRPAVKELRGGGSGPYGGGGRY